MRFHRLNWLPCRVTRREKERPKHLKEQQKSNQNLSPWTMHMRFWSQSFFCLLISSPVWTLYFFIYQFIFFHWSISFIVFGIQRRGAAVIVLVKTCRSVRYVAYVMNSQTTLTSLACQKTWAFAIYYERKKDFVFKVCKYYSQLKHEFD